MEETYKKLNYYLNEIFKYLEIEHPFFYKNLINLARFNDAFLNRMEQYTFESNIKCNHLTWEEVFLLAREIIERIDSSYLEAYDRLVPSGILDFSYDCDDSDSYVLTTYDCKGNIKRKIINVSRAFNYDDVRKLVHEFIHYTNDLEFSVSRNQITEFLSIYFEYFAIFYMLEKGIDTDELDCYLRLKKTIANSKRLYNYEIVLVAYREFGPLDESSFDFLNRFVCSIDKERFEKNCRLLCNNLKKAEKKIRDEGNDNPNRLGEFLTEEFIGIDYKYFFNTCLAVYARKYCSFDDIVNLNNRIANFKGKSVEEMCMSVGIDLSDSDFMDRCFSSLDDLIRELKTFQDSKGEL